jgi:hypothetical protein
MIKFTLLLRRNPALSYEEFVDHHATRHAPLFLSVPIVKRYVRRYVQQHAFPIGLPGLPPMKHDGVTEVWFDEMAGLAAVFSDRDYLTLVRPDELYLLDFSGCEFIVSAENVVLDTTRTWFHF